ncbi:OLC1v1033956C1 [Oldenlandia corymbosa var. corymbosa]|uniref:OLC1v1033956C1 n=1 Tax=Oldenlandia corymbosa var. corymbosa TaxID=529605 RepID=A0AAV1CPK6_OLDCO|nr:OLC1v1033956C1 [Oldenlandia corymbosa var. corymbosa]
MSEISEHSNARSNPSADIISNLPSELIQHILGLMPLRDAARTCALSRHWRNVWLKLPKLVFDRTFGRVYPLDPSSREKVLLRISQILLAHDGPILEFKLSIPGLESCWETDQFMKSVSRKGVQKLVLKFPRGNRHTLHSSTFSCRELEKLILRGCDIKPPPSFRGFSNLVRLMLSEITVTADVLARFIAGSPFLKCLCLDGSPPCDVLTVISPKLKCLFCHTYFGTSIRVFAPRLINVSLISNVPRAMLEGKQTTLQAKDFLKHVCILALDHYYMKMLLRAGSSFKFKNLSVLSLHGIYFPSVDEVKGVLLFIDGCPTLRKIKIAVARVFSNFEALTNRDTVEFFKGLKEKDISSCHVREVEMLYVTGSWPELAFMRMLLNKLLMLETMVIEPNFEIVNDGGLYILKEVSKFSRVSSRAIVKFKDQN